METLCLLNCENSNLPLILLARNLTVLQSRMLEDGKRREHHHHLLPQSYYHQSSTYKRLVKIHTYVRTTLKYVHTVRAYTHIHTYVRTTLKYVHTVRAYTHLHTYAYTYYTKICTYVHIHICIHMYITIYVHTYMHVSAVAYKGSEWLSRSDRKIRL